MITIQLNKFLQNFRDVLKNLTGFLIQNIQLFTQKTLTGKIKCNLLYHTSLENLSYISDLRFSKNLTE